MQFIFIMGCQRSGTTLMGQILGAHPEAVLIDESNGLYTWAHAVLSQSDRAELDRLFHNCCRSAMANYQSPEERFLVDGTLRNTVNYMVLKAPNLTYEYAQLKTTFQNARILYMLRDIRAVVASVMRLTSVPILANQTRFILGQPDLKRIYPSDVSLLTAECAPEHVKIATMAKIKMSLAEQFENRGLGVVRVRYEDLTGAPGVMIPRILAGFGLPTSSYCLEPSRIFQGKGPGDFDRGRPIDIGSHVAWRNVLSPRQETEVWNAVGAFMEKHGYRRDDDIVAGGRPH